MCISGAWIGRKGHTHACLTGRNNSISKQQPVFPSSLPSPCRGNTPQITFCGSTTVSNCPSGTFCQNGGTQLSTVCCPGAGILHNSLNTQSPAVSIQATRAVSHNWPAVVNRQSHAGSSTHKRVVVKRSCFVVYRVIRTTLSAMINVRHRVQVGGAGWIWFQL
jgi:hypothetical protein